MSLTRSDQYTEKPKLQSESAFFPLFTTLGFFGSISAINKDGPILTGKKTKLDFWRDTQARKPGLSFIKQTTWVGAGLDGLLFAGQALKEQANETNYHLKWVKSGAIVGGTLGLVPATQVYTRLNDLRSIFFLMPSSRLPAAAVLIGCATAGAVIGGVADVVAMSQSKRQR